MGMRKPLVRAGFVAFVLPSHAKISFLIETHADSLGRYYLLYAVALMSAMLLWSVAFLHRQRELEIAGAIGAVAGIAPILALMPGHVVLGAGAALGIGSLLAATDGAVPGDFSFIKIMDALYCAWGIASAFFLARTHSSLARERLLWGRPATVDAPKRPIHPGQWRSSVSLSLQIK